MNDYSDKLPTLALVQSAEEEFEILANAIKQRALPDRPLEILEAGCGNAWSLDLGDVQYRLTGVDLDADALQIRKQEHQDLDEAILGDLHSVELADNQYDVIYNSFVLEHVRDTVGVLENFLRWLRPGGIMILKLPDKDSVYGFITRTTPHIVHVIYKKYIEGNPNAGKPGFAPYPTIYESSVSRTGIRSWAASHGLSIVEEFGANYYIDDLGNFALPVKTLIRLVQTASRGKLSGDHTNLTFVIQKPE